MTTQALERAASPEDEVELREVRRLAGMGHAHQAWERAALQRHRDAQNPVMP
jgi:hypothetical protein